jgi:hypothetical protein
MGEITIRQPQVRFRTGAKLLHGPFDNLFFVNANFDVAADDGVRSVFR